VLADQGLGDALRALARGSSLPLTVDVDGIGRYPPEVESAVYFCCLEALQNATKHADGASTITISLTGNGSLRFEVSDDGPGFAEGSVRPGLGFVNMRDRLAAVGGELTISSASGAGTQVVGAVPLF
jgi:signal transduction histidine kinase